MRLLTMALGLTGLVAISFAGTDESTIELTRSEGRDVTQGSCAICHSLDYITMNAPLMDRARWQATVRKMIDRYGAPIDAQSAELITAYLSENYVRRDPVAPPDQPISR